MTDFDPDLDLAYFFAPSPRPHDLGHPRMLIHLRSKPTGRHFDPEYVLVKVLSGNGDAENLRISHPWHGADSFRVFPGRVILRDRFGKTAEAFTFGGTLHIRSEEEQTSLEITSSAPILDLTEGRTRTEALVEEVEILLAEEQARLASKADEFERKLASLDAQTLYTACFIALLQKFNHYPIVENSPTEELVRVIRTEVRHFYKNGELSQSSPSLSDLLN